MTSPARVLIPLCAFLLWAFASPVAAQEIQNPDPAMIVGAPTGAPRTGEDLDRATVRVAALLRCPTCQGLSVNDSPASMALKMKQQTRDLLAAGYSDEQVLQYFEKSYGEFVRLQPPLRGVNWLVWLAPVAILIVGGFFVARSMRALRRQPEAVAGAPVANDLPEDPELDPYLLKVRQLAYGSTDEHERS